VADRQRIDDLRRRVEQDPASIAFAQLAEELRRAGDAAEAIDVCRAGLRLHPDFVSARLTLGRALVALNQLDAAYEELQRVVGSVPDNLAAIRAVADVWRQRGNLREALSHYRAALALAHNDPELQELVAQLSREVGVQPDRERAARTVAALERFLAKVS